MTIDADAERRLWTLGAPPGVLGRPVVAGGTVYLPIADGRLAAVDPDRGRVLWCSAPLTEPDTTRPVPVGEVVVMPVQREHGRCGYVALDAVTGTVRWKRIKSDLHRVAAAGSTLVLWNDTYDERGKIAGVDALTGELLWENEFERIWRLLVRGERVILDAGGLRALDARSGEELWRKGHGNPLPGPGSPLPGQQGTDDAAVFHVWKDGTEPELSLRAADTGEQLAATRFPRRALRHFSGPPILLDGGRALFAESYGRRLQLFAHSGLAAAEPLLELRFARWRFTSFSEDPVCVGDWVYVVAGRRDQVYAAQCGDGSGPRRIPVTAPDGRTMTLPRAVAGPGHLFLSDGRTVAAVRDGRVLWTKATDMYDSQPVPLGSDRVLFPSRSRTADRNRLHCADAETGHRLT
ncbi:PQQ-binding-like beta-propeller repeat protein [Streptomyces griseosporeus]|uniref:outer membrane protein assembly factor BamB family protein n=1 Tax=Streptomyces griseosporeus TaxID=1910 RepID=UPI0036F94F04